MPVITDSIKFKIFANNVLLKQAEGEVIQKEAEDLLLQYLQKSIGLTDSWMYNNRQNLLGEYLSIRSTQLHAGN